RQWTSGLRSGPSLHRPALSLLPRLLWLLRAVCAVLFRAAHRIWLGLATLVTADAKADPKGTAKTDQSHRVADGLARATLNRERRIICSAMVHLCLLFG